MKIYIETLGCPKNEVDSENAAGVLEQAGHEIVEGPEEAEAILVNTCAFINDAKEESIDRIFDMAAYKENGALLLVSGCLSQRYGEKLAQLIPEADIFLGVNDYKNLPEILAAHEAGKQDVYQSECAKPYAEPGVRKAKIEKGSAYLRIAEGCDNHCAYCVIPSIRGGYRSRTEEAILAEASGLVRLGARELILVAQDVTAYGIDLYKEFRLPKLLEKLCKIEDLRWIRLMYCYEDRITDELIRVMGENPKICPYIDIPIQHASDPVLKGMGRRSTRASIENTLARLRAGVPGIHIRTTLITGFPGERMEHFHELESFVEEQKFERLGVFAYSKEEGTPAAAMKGQVRQQTKENRRELLMALQQEISLEHNEEKVGKEFEVLVEGLEVDGRYTGRTAFDAPEIDNQVLFPADEELQPGDFALVRITEALDYDLLGEYICRL
ncbi:MAG: 30S ribosomal protein S12 methylthiotransferase RimO [Firmicutes bacterium]|nr:30S ribosomal protein S12 methylthiotransferase RimO [Bacillota bacterium]